MITFFFDEKPDDDEKLDEKPYETYGVKLYEMNAFYIFYDSAHLLWDLRLLLHLGGLISGADKTNGAANAVKINKIKYSLDQSYGDVLYYSIPGTDK